MIKNPGKKALKDADIRETPRGLFDALNREFSFTLDACATIANALCPVFCTEQGHYCKGLFPQEPEGASRLNNLDGLQHSWAGHRVFFNPPFSELLAWTDKAWTECGRASAMVGLVPANRTEQEWWQKNVAPYVKETGFTVRWLDERTVFTMNGGQPIYARDKAGNIKRTKKGEPIIGAPSFACCLLIWSAT